MANWGPSRARRYHERTKHSVESVRAGAQLLDWRNRPNPFKEYAGVEPLPLRGDPPRPQVPALEALAAGGEAAAAELALPDLARLLRWGARVVRTRTFPGGRDLPLPTEISAGGRAAGRRPAAVWPRSRRSLRGRRVR